MRYLIVLFLITGCPMPKPCLPTDTTCAATPAMEQSCRDSGGTLAIDNCGTDGRPAWACCYEGRGCNCFQVE